ncbi:hypothetical protein LCGC14_0599680 [marine sediment metagenome]|uniref:Uncharacterized protein n=1 Tax=marine sediment metagenome TaxID=412755 RepID=A0A0F9UJC2_9ZZZZ
MGDLAKRNAALAQVDFGAFAGGGMENVGAGDVLMPFLGIVQALSPQVEKGHAKFIEGAEVGDLYNTVTNELYGDGKQVCFVACCKETQYVEWIKRDDGGGLVGFYEPGDPFVNDIIAKAKDKFKLETADGHDLVETHYVYGYLIDGPEGKSIEEPVVVSFSSSKIKVYKGQLMTRIRTIKNNPPMFGFRFTITTVADKNKKGQPYKNFKIDPACGDMATSANVPGGDYEGLLHAGLALVKSVHGGSAKADHTGSTNESVVAPGSNEEEHF